MNVLSDKKCPNCKMSMKTDGKTYWCPGCGTEIPRVRHDKKRPKKVGYRTRFDIQEER